MSNVDFKVENPGDVNVTLTITLPLSAWLKVKGDMKQPWNYPMSNIAAAIENVADRAQKTFYAEISTST